MEKKPLSSTFTTTSKKCWKSKLQHTHLKKKQKQPNNFILPCGKKTPKQLFADVHGHSQQPYETKTLAQVFPRELCEIFKNIYFTEHLRGTAYIKYSIYCNMNIKQSKIVQNLIAYWKINIS